MASNKKIKEKLLRHPTAKDVKWNELRKFLISIGFEEKQGDGSKVRFYRPGKNGGRGTMIRLHRPHPEPECKPYIIREVVEKLNEEDLS